MERNIGEIFEVDGVKLQIVEDFDNEMSCNGCYFFDDDEQYGLLKCFASQRKDRKSVKFIKIGD